MTFYSDGNGQEKMMASRKGEMRKRIQQNWKLEKVDDLVVCPVACRQAGAVRLKEDSRRMEQGRRKRENSFPDQCQQLAQPKYW